MKKTRRYTRNNSPFFLRRKLTDAGTKKRTSKVTIAPITLLIMFTIYDTQAQTLSEAVNAQLASDSLPCQRLLNGDPDSVLTGNLRDVICARAVPLGSTSQTSGGGSANPTSLSSRVPHPQQDEKNENNMNESTIGTNWSIFLTAEAESLNRDITRFEDGFTSDVVRISAGSSYIINKNADLTFALTNQEHKGDYKGGGNFKTSSTGLKLLGTYHPQAHSFVQAMAGYDSVSSERLRTTSFDESFNNSLVFSQSGSPNTNFDYNQTELSILAGYNYTNANMTLTPQFGLTQLVSDYGTYSETGDSGLELTIHNDKRESLQSVIDLQGSLVFSTSIAVMIPQLQLRWLNEHADKSRKVNVSFVGDTRSRQFSYDTEAGDRSYYQAGIGMVFIFSKGIQSFIRVQTLLDHDFYHGNTATAGLNIEL